MKKYEEFVNDISSRVNEIYKEIDRIKMNLVDIDELNEEIETNKHIMTTYKEYLNVKETLDKLNYNPGEYDRLLKTYNSLYLYQNECPECKTLLTIYGNKIEKASYKDKESINYNFLTVKGTIESLKSKKMKYDILTEDLHNLYSKIRFPVWSESELRDKMNIKKKQTELRSRLKELESNLKTITWCRMTKPEPISISDNQYLEYVDKIELYSSYNAKSEYINNMVKTLEQKINELEARSQKLGKESCIHDKLTDNLDEYKKKLERMEKEYEEGEKILKYTSILHEFQFVKQEYLDACEFQKIFMKTQSDIMMYTLNSINIIIKKYLNGFFENKIIDFSFYVNETKNCIDTVLKYGEQMPVELSMLSGGEYDRVILATSLSFAEFFKIPILLLDEVTTSLDITTYQMCIEHIEKVYPDDQNIIYIGHQTITGLFENVINLDE
jgi:DNA repair ATPase RecN